MGFGAEHFCFVYLFIHLGFYILLKYMHETYNTSNLQKIAVENI